MYIEKTLMKFLIIHAASLYDLIICILVVPGNTRVHVSWYMNQGKTIVQIKSNSSTVCDLSLAVPSKLNVCN